MSYVPSEFSRPSALSLDAAVRESQAVEEIKLLASGRQAALANRRNFLTKLAAGGAAAGALALTGCDDSVPAVTAPASGPSVVDVLNFALNLEYLEAQFYAYVTTGGGIPTADQGTSPGTTTGGAKVTFSNTYVASVANQLATDERLHVELLRSAISSMGGTPVAMPALNLAANGAVTSDATFLAAARQLETVGISAYAGGAQYLISSTASLQYAAQILDVEAQHEGFLRELCIQLGVSSLAVDSQDIPPTATAIFNTSATTGLNAVRNTSQVLQITYGAVGKTGISSGGFFPNGMNGNIKTT